MGRPLRSRRGRDRRCAEQLRRAALLLAPYELAALLLGRRRLDQPVHHERRPDAQRQLAGWLPHGRRDPAHSDGAAVFLPSSVESVQKRRRGGERRSTSPARSARRAAHQRRPADPDRLLRLLRRRDDSRPLGQQLSRRRARHRARDGGKLCLPFLSRHHLRPLPKRLCRRPDGRQAHDPHRDRRDGPRRRADPAAAALRLALARRACGLRSRLCAGLSFDHPLHAPQLRQGELPGDHRRADGERLRRQHLHAAALRPDRTASVAQALSGVPRAAASRPPAYDRGSQPTEGP